MPAVKLDVSAGGIAEWLEHCMMVWDAIANPTDSALATQVARSHLSSTGRIPDPPSDPKADQIEKHNNWITTLGTGGKTCKNIGMHCPDVDPIQEGEPLYEFLRDPENDGVTCESL